MKLKIGRRTITLEVLQRQELRSARQEEVGYVVGQVVRLGAER
jgi:hypothetical protein